MTSEFLARFMDAVQMLNLAHDACESHIEYPNPEEELYSPNAKSRPERRLFSFPAEWRE
jgi:hypothetical protein